MVTSAGFAIRYETPPTNGGTDISVTKDQGFSLDQIGLLCLRLKFGRSGVVSRGRKTDLVVRSKVNKQFSTECKVNRIRGYNEVVRSSSH